MNIPSVTQRPTALFNSGVRKRALVKSSDGRHIKKIKNLGWLLRNWKAIDRLEWVSLSDTTRAILGMDRMTDGIFKAYMRDGREYITPYASFQVWTRFINRPVFRGLPVNVNGIEGTV